MPLISVKPLPEMVERLVFSTDVQRPFSGEFRTWHRDPRTELAYQFRMSEADYAAFEEDLLANVTADWTVPLWHERTRNLDLSVGQSVISVDTDADYRANSYALIWKGCDEYEIATVASVGVGSITLSAGVSASYDGAAVMPAHDGFIMAPLDTAREHRGRIEVAVQFQLRDHADLSATVWATYAGYEVLNCASGYISRLTGLITPNVEYIGQDFGPVVIETTRNLADIMFAVEISKHAWDAKRFLHQVAGRDSPFWVKAWGGQLEVAAATAPSATIVVTETRAAADMINRHIVVDGQYRQITNAVAGTGGVQTLTLDSGLSADVEAGAPTSLLSLVRCDSDEIEIEHLHGFSSLVSFPIVEERAV